ncbi:hypothetical protein [Hyphomicrobium sp.]|uniref:hypothetical protein n=1 Tax=Hyphomicrobium sp. TaxID=82 RepID=UPI0025B86389|nr:hypothetical protein [Hyphomicrobium sp.]MCC7252277.1 hypothetical protein [Hyphomicrobium sp.]
MAILPNDTSPRDAADSRAAGEAFARNVKERVLVFIVVFLGLLILAGLAAVVLRIIYLSSTPGAQRTMPEAGQSAVAATADRLDLPAGGSVKSVSVNGDRLAVHYEAPGGAGIVILDVASGAVLRRVDVVPGGVPR